MELANAFGVVKKPSNVASEHLGCFGTNAENGRVYLSVSAPVWL